MLVSNTSMMGENWNFSLELNVLGTLKGKTKLNRVKGTKKLNNL